MDTDMQNHAKQKDIKQEELAFLEIPDPREYLDKDVKVCCVMQDGNGATIDVEHNNDALMQFMTRRRSLSIITTTSEEAFREVIDPYADIKFTSGMQLAAGRQVFMTLMINAWRKRNNDCMLLQKQIEVQDRLFAKTKDDLNYYTALFHRQQKCTDDLNAKLKDSAKILKANQLCHEQLTQSTASLEAENTSLQKQVELKDQEYKRAMATFNLARVELFDVERRAEDLYVELQDLLRQEENLKLINQQQSVQTALLLGQYHDDVANCKEELLADEAAIQFEKQKLQNEISYLKHEKQDICNTWTLTKEQLARTLQSHRSKVEALKAELAKVPSVRFMIFWLKVMKYRVPISSFVHWMAHIFVPVVPQPKISACSPCIGLKRAFMKVVKK